MTGMRMAQTRGGKKFWRGWSESTKGCCLLLAGAEEVSRRIGGEGIGIFDGIEHVVISRPTGEIWVRVV